MKVVVRRHESLTAGPSTTLRSGPTANRGRRDDKVEGSAAPWQSRRGMYGAGTTSATRRAAVGPERSVVEGLRFSIFVFSGCSRPDPLVLQPPPDIPRRQSALFL